MIVHPLPYRSNTPRIPLGVMKTSGELHGDLGGIVFADSAQPLIRLARARGGTATIIRGRGATRWLKFTIEGTVYYPGIPNPSLSEIHALENFAADRGVEMSSFPRVAFNLFRSTLPGFSHIAMGDTMPRGMFPPGARLHARPGVYTDAVSVDLRAAYLWAIGTLRIPVMYSRGKARLSEIVECPGGFALASVRLRKEVPYGPVPCFSDNGTTAYPTRRERYTPPALLSSEDLKLASMMGDVRIESAWTGKRFTSPFTSFYHLAKELRSECGDSGKQVANTLWGIFSAGASVSLVEFRKGENRARIRKMPARDPLCFPVAATVLSRIRAKVYYEAIGENTVHVHTDGVIATGSVSHLPLGEDPGSWRIVGRYPEIEVLSPGWYRYVNAEGVEKIKAAGRMPANDEMTRRVFNHRRGEWLQQSRGAVVGGMVLPSLRRVDTDTV